MSGFLALEDGTVFRGRSVGALGVAHGEAVFTTAMTGYQEVVTDPSFAEQLVAFTAPMIGNYGVSPQRSESTRTHARAVIMRRATGEDWPRWLHGQGIVALEEIDTRALVVRLREHGAMRAAAVAGAASVDEVLAAGAGAGGDGGPRARRRRVHERARTRSARARPRSPCSTTAASDSIVRRLEDRRGPRDRLAARHGRGHDPRRPARRRAPLQRPRRPGRAARSGRGRPRAARPRADPRHLPRATSFSRWPPASRPSSCRSATAARTIRCSSWRRAASSSRARTTASRCAATAPRSPTSRSTTAPSRASRSAKEHARSLQFHPEAGPGPHDAWPIIESWVEEVRYAQAA